MPEVWISGFCPHCDRVLSIFRESGDFRTFYQCPECFRVLTIISLPMNKVMIEPNTDKQREGDVMPMPSELRGINA